jgi:lysyl-tRNA synthetase class 2
MDPREKHTAPWRSMFNEQVLVRLEKLKKLQESGEGFKNGFTPNATAGQLQAEFASTTKEDLEKLEKVYQVAGRVMFVRDFGTAAFVQIDDGSGRLQIYVSRNDLPEGDFAKYKLLDGGDIVAISGKMMRTNKGELSVHAKGFDILTKSMRPLPEKFHGLSDQELRYRMRYVDMITNEDSRKVLRQRSEIVRYIRDFFYQRDFLEVETPMLHSVAGGAAAKPFQTHHNALDMDLNLRIAPELHLKRLIVGGFPRVFELNRCFRNEGLSIKHNPEFTSIEFYQAYATYEDLMDLTEDLLAGLGKDLLKTESLTYGERSISLKRPFARMTMREAVMKKLDLSEAQSRDRAVLLGKLKDLPLNHAQVGKYSADKLLVVCFEEFVEKELVDPTFITAFPTEVSPLSRRNDKDPSVVDRFELYMNGWEIANAFSELNNPIDQLERFADQALQKEAGDDEATEVDYDYVRALEYGMPPTAGEGIGIDRLVMVLTNSPSIRDVLLFPQLKKEVFF